MLRSIGQPWLDASPFFSDEFLWCGHIIIGRSQQSLFGRYGIRTI
jgi:hypothetical protein